MQKLNPLGIGPKIGIVAFPYFIAAIVLNTIYPEIFSFGPGAKQALQIAGFIWLGIGVVLYAFTVKTLMKGLKDGRMMTAGPFRFCQNPLYAVMILLIIPGIALALDSWIVLTTSVIAYIIFKINIHKEYEEMERIFGEEYRAYRKRTPEFFPF